MLLPRPEGHRRPLRICLWDPQQKIVSAEKALLEERLGMLGEFTLISSQDLTEPHLAPVDLLVASGLAFDGVDLARWLDRLASRVLDQNGIPVPTLILAKFDFRKLRSIVGKAVTMNWYFDILNPSDMDSLPIRVANLLRMHDHLHEVSRWQSLLTTLEEEVLSLTAELTELKAQPSKSR